LLALKPQEQTLRFKSVKNKKSHLLFSKWLSHLFNKIQELLLIFLFIVSFFLFRFSLFFLSFSFFFFGFCFHFVSFYSSFLGAAFFLLPPLASSSICVFNADNASKSPNVEEEACCFGADFFLPPPVAGFFLGAASSTLE